MPDVGLILTSMGLQEGTEDYDCLKESAEQIVDSYERYNKQDLWLIRILKMLESHNYELCGGGTNINGKCYAKTAGIMHTKINEYLNGIISKSEDSKLKCQAALIGEIKQNLVGIDSETPGSWFFNRGKRMPSTVLLYKKILQDFTKISTPVIRITPTPAPIKQISSDSSWWSRIYHFFKGDTHRNFKSALKSYTKTCQEQEEDFVEINLVQDYFHRESDSILRAFGSLNQNGDQNHAIQRVENQEKTKLVQEIKRLTRTYPELPKAPTTAMVLETERERIIHHTKIRALTEEFLKEYAESIDDANRFLGQIP